jgi:integrase
MVYSGKSDKSHDNSMDIQMSTSMQYFISGIKTEATKKQYLIHLEKFRSYFKIKDYDSLLTIPVVKIKEMIEQYVISCKNKKNVKAAINSKVCAIELFYGMNEIEISTKRARKMFPDSLKTGGGKPYSRKQIQETQKCLTSKHALPFKVGIMIIASSGARSGFTEYLKVKHIGEFQKNGCKSILIYGGEKQEYHSFITPETVKLIDQWLEYRKSQGELITDNSWIVPSTKDHTKPMTNGILSIRLTKFLESIDRGESIGKHYEIAITHGFRKFWNTIAKNTPNTNSNNLEKMFGHSTSHSLDNTYYKPSLEDLFVDYEKFSDGLAISEEAIQIIELQNKDKIIEATHAEKDDRIQKLEAKLERFEAFMRKTVKFD